MGFLCLFMFSSLIIILHISPFTKFLEIFSYNPHILISVSLFPISFLLPIFSPAAICMIEEEEGGY